MPQQTIFVVPNPISDDAGSHLCFRLSEESDFGQLLKDGICGIGQRQLGPLSSNWIFSPHTAYNYILITDDMQ